jgi:hypothetical protein
MDRGPVTHFSGGGAFGREKSGIAAFRLSPLVVGAGNIDPETAPPFWCGDFGEPEPLGVIDSGSAITEDLGDADLEEGNASDAEGRHATAYHRTYPGRSFGCLCYEFARGVTITAGRSGVGGDVENIAVHGK